MLRFTVCTHNLWKDYRWIDRAESLRQFVRLHQPDIYCLQELRPVSRELIATALPGHQCVEDSFQGWVDEGNIFWNTKLFTLIEHGAEPIGIFEEFRRLFWVRLQPQDPAASPLLVATAHYTWPGNTMEKQRAVNPRVEQAHRTLVALEQLADLDTPVLFMGDLNDFVHPLRILRDGGLTDCFAALGRSPQLTHPAEPTAQGTPSTIDWMLHRGPLMPMTCEVVDFFVGDMAPSDHKPVLATYRFASS